MKHRDDDDSFDFGSDDELPGESVKDRLSFSKKGNMSRAVDDGEEVSGENQRNDEAVQEAATATTPTLDTEQLTIAQKQEFENSTEQQPRHEVTSTIPASSSANAIELSASELGALLPYKVEEVHQATAACDEVLINPAACSSHRTTHDGTHVGGGIVSPVVEPANTVMTTTIRTRRAAITADTLSNTKACDEDFSASTGSSTTCTAGMSTIHTAATTTVAPPTRRGLNQENPTTTTEGNDISIMTAKRELAERKQQVRQLARTVTPEVVGVPILDVSPSACLNSEEMQVVITQSVRRAIQELLAVQEESRTNDLTTRQIEALAYGNQRIENLIVEALTNRQIEALTCESQRIESVMVEAEAAGQVSSPDPRHSSSRVCPDPPATHECQGSITSTRQQLSGEEISFMLDMQQQIEMNIRRASSCLDPPVTGRARSTETRGKSDPPASGATDGSTPTSNEEEVESIHEDEVESIHEEVESIHEDETYLQAAALVPGAVCEIDNISILTIDSSHSEAFPIKPSRMSVCSVEFPNPSANAKEEGFAADDNNSVLTEETGIRKISKTIETQIQCWLNMGSGNNNASYAVHIEELLRQRHEEYFDNTNQFATLLGLDQQVPRQAPGAQQVLGLFGLDQQVPTLQQFDSESIITYDGASVSGISSDDATPLLAAELVSEIDRANTTRDAEMEYLTQAVVELQSRMDAIPRVHAEPLLQPCPRSKRSWQVWRRKKATI